MLGYGLQVHDSPHEPGTCSMHISRAGSEVESESCNWQNVAVNLTALVYFVNTNTVCLVNNMAPRDCHMMSGLTLR